MSASRIQVYQYFQTDDIPTESQFRYLFNNLWFKDEKFPIVQIEGLTEMFQGTMSSQSFENHLNDTGAHTGYLALLNASNLTASNVNAWKSKLNISYAATIDGTDQPGNVHTKNQILEIVAGLVSQDDETLQIIENIREMLTSDDVNLDELQEVINYIKQNREQIELLQQVIVGSTTDDKITLTGQYPNWGVNLQNHFNATVYDKVNHLEQEIDQLSSERFTIEIPNQQIITHKLNTYDFVIDAFDTVSLYSLPLRVRRIDLNNIEVEFDSTPNQPVKVTIRKI
jgi:hypothetical protein